MRRLSSVLSSNAPRMWAMARCSSRVTSGYGIAANCLAETFGNVEPVACARRAGR